MPYLRTLIMALLAGASLISSAQSLDTEKLDTYFDHLESNEEGMGSVSIFKNGEEVYQRSIGLADIESNTSAGPATVYRIGSISKTFTATLIMQLVDEGKLSLGTPLAKFYPNLPNSQDITIEHLLRHRSGLYNFTNAEDYPTFMEAPMSEQELIDLFIENGTIFEPDEKFEYSNTNYVLLSFILEAIEDMGFGEILAKRITQPCDLPHTYYGGTIGDKPNEAFSYTKGDGWNPGTETDMSIPLGAGAIVSTPTDVNQFLNCLFAGDLISEASFETMKTIVDGYGLGIFTLPFGDKQAYGHTGGIDAFQSMTGHFPKEEITVTYLANGVSYPVNSIMIGVLNIVFEQPFELPVFAEPDMLDAYEGTYSSPNLPIKLKIYREGTRLYGQGTGQPAFPLDMVDEKTFKFDPAGLSITFMPEENKLILSQGGGQYEMTLEE